MPVTTPCAHRGDAYRAAHGELETIVAANPAFVEALRLLAGAKQALGDPAAAEGLLRRALPLDPNWTPTLATLGELLLARYYNDTGRPGEALGVAAPSA